MSQVFAGGRTSTGPLARRALKLLEGDLRQKLAQVETTAIRTLLGAAEQAESLDEIKLIFRYQRARFPDKWDAALVTAIVAAFDESAKVVEATAPGVAEEEMDRRRAEAAARQLAFIALAHRVAVEGARPAPTTGGSPSESGGRIGQAGHGDRSGGGKKS